MYLTWMSGISKRLVLWGAKQFIKYLNFVTLFWELFSNAYIIIAFIFQRKKMYMLMDTVKNVLSISDYKVGIRM